MSGNLALKILKSYHSRFLPSNMQEAYNRCIRRFIVACIMFTTNICLPQEVMRPIFELAEAASHRGTNWPHDFTDWQDFPRTYLSDTPWPKTKTRIDGVPYKKIIHQYLDQHGTDPVTGRIVLSNAFDNYKTLDLEEIVSEINFDNCDAIANKTITGIIRGHTFKNVVFLNVKFVDAKFVNCRFKQFAFIGCTFKGSMFYNCRFRSTEWKVHEFNHVRFFRFLANKGIITLRNQQLIDGPPVEIRNTRTGRVKKFHAYRTLANSLDKKLYVVLNGTRERYHSNMLARFEDLSKKFWW